MDNPFLWSFLMMSNYVLTIWYMAAFYYIFKYTIIFYEQRAKPPSWMGLLTGIMVLGVANLIEAITQTYSAFTTPALVQAYTELGANPVATMLIVLTLLFKYGGLLLLFLGAYLLKKEVVR